LVLPDNVGMTMCASRWLILLLLLCLGPQSVAAVSLAGCRHPASVQALGEVPPVQGEHEVADDSATRAHAHEWSADSGGVSTNCPCGCTCFDHGCVGGVAPAAVTLHRHDFPAMRTATCSVPAVLDIPAPIPGELIRPPNPA
jgi:hypothetical protein